MLIYNKPTDNVLRGLQESLSVLSPELMPIHERLVNIRRQLVALAAKETASQAALAAKAQEEEKEGTPTAHPADYDDMKTPTYHGSPESDMESKTPTKDQPNPEPIVLPKIKAELKPLQEELRKIDSLSVRLIRCSLQPFILAALLLPYCSTTDDLTTTVNELMGNSWVPEGLSRPLRRSAHLFSKTVSTLSRRFER